MTIHTNSSTTDLETVLCNLLDCGALNAHELMLMLSLAFRTEYGNGWYCEPTYKTICSDTQMSIGTVIKIVRNLEQRYLIDRTRRPQQSNVYYINFGLIATLANKARKDGQPVNDINYRAPWETEAAMSKD